jgi:hypothetical protein
MKNILIYGNSVGVLVSGLELSNDSNNKISIINPTKNWGGYFGGIIINGNKFDIGMNLLEFTSFISNNEADLLNYNPNIKSESGKYSKIVTEYVKNVIETQKVRTPEIYINKTFYKDYYISNSLEFLNNIDLEVKENIVKELTSNIENVKNLHAKFKNINSDLFSYIDFKTVSLKNHGSTFHDLFLEPLINKILFISSISMPAILHRIPWAPLYYPETLLNKLTSKNSFEIDVTEFEYPTLNKFSVFSERLFATLESKDNIEIIQNKIMKIDSKKNQLFLMSNELLQYDELIIGCDITEYASLSDKNNESQEFEKANFNFIFARFNRSDFLKDFSILFIVDNDIPIYRITNQSILEGNQSEYYDIVLEINLDFLNNNFSESTFEIVKKSLLKMKILNKFNPIFLEIKEFRNAVNLPTFDNIKKYNIIKENITVQKNIHFIGNINSLFSNSFNDNIIQALFVAKKIKS